MELDLGAAVADHSSSLIPFTPQWLQSTWVQN